MKRCARWVLLVAVSGFLSPGMARSADYWVARRGMDRERGGGRTNPWASLQFAANHVKAGDTVHVLDGDYVGFDLRRGGDEQSPIRFIAEGKAVRITQRNSRTPDGINIEGAGHVVLDGFVVSKMPRAGVRAA